MNFLLDTNVVSEPTKPQRSAPVLRWQSEQPVETLFISVLTLGELRKGILMLEEGARRRRLLRWVESEVEAFFEGRILDVNATIMRAWAELQNRGQRQGRVLPAMDSLLAATALAHDLTVVTRNTADYATTGVRLVNPWQV